MSQQGPILVVSSDGWPPFATALDQAQMFPVIETGWADAARAITQVRPTAVLAAMAGSTEPRLAALATQIAARKPYLPLIAVGPKGATTDNAIPFTDGSGNFDRLLARLRAALRRAAPSGDPIVHVGDVEVDLEKQELRIRGAHVHLTPHQFELLSVFARNVGKLLTHRMLLQEVWGPGYVGDPNLVRVYVAQLRRKIESDPARPRYLLTEPGAGYRFVDPA